MALCERCNDSPTVVVTPGGNPISMQTLCIPCAEKVCSQSCPTGPVVEYLSGPMSLTQHWSDEYGKMIYIFGEYHGEEDDCGDLQGAVEIQNYLAELFETSDVFIDFYLEVSAYKGDGWSREGLAGRGIHPDAENFYLSRLITKFDACFQKASRYIPACRNMRAHYVNIRQVDGVPDTDIEKTIDLLIHVPYLNDRQANYLRTLLRRIQAYPDIATYLGASLQSVTSSNKEISKALRSVRGKISEFVMNKVLESFSGKVQATIKRDIDYLAVIEGPFDDDAKPYADSLGRNLANVMVPLVDGYTLARIFKEFDIDKYPSVQEETWTQPVEPRHVIIYAGEQHALNCREFLSTLDFKEIDSAKSAINWRCLDMREFTQPLFG